MQLKIKCRLQEPLLLPINYHHILQSVLYKNAASFQGYNDFLHDSGYWYGDRVFKMFTFGPIQGKYSIEKKNIIFYDEIMVEVRSTEALFLRILCENIEKNGLLFGEMSIKDVEPVLGDNTIEADEVVIRMISPVCVYSTDKETGKTHYYAPHEEAFSERLNAGFGRKYQAYTGRKPEGEIVLVPHKITERDKYVTRYQGIYINAWKGEYLLKGRRKYLDFLYQTGIGSKNAQGFGMFAVAEEKSRDSFIQK